jgi:hypothetical protein
MIDVVNKHCIHEGCMTSANFNTPDNILFCTPEAVYD